MDLKKSIKWLLGFSFKIVLLGILLSIIANLITPRLMGKELEILKEVLKLLKLYWIFLVLALVTILCLFFLFRLRKIEAEFRGIFEFYKSVKKLIPEDFKIQKYKNTYIFRTSNGAIANLLKDRRHVLITGKPKIGKTRAAYEEIKKLEHFSVIKAKPDRIENIEELKLPLLRNRNFILFLDDLEGFVGKGVEDLIDRLKKNNSKLILVATCRTGEELDSVKEELLPLHIKKNGLVPGNGN